MTLSLQRVRVDDIYPLVDEYGNEFVSRDYELEANKKYVSELAASFANGEPDEPVKLVRDGDAYRIKAGNTRVRAMKELGTEECWAVIDDEDTVQSVVETVVRTNTKKKYEPVEESKFTQQLFLFGGDDYVSEVSSIGVENAGKLRRAREMAGEKADQMTLDRMYALSELDGFPELAEKMLSDSETEWRYRIDGYRRQKRDALQIKEYQVVASKLDVELVEDHPSDKRYINNCKSPEDFQAKYMAARVLNTDVVGRIAHAWDGCYIDFYGTPLNEEKESAEEAEKRRKVEEYGEVIKGISEDMLSWVRCTLDRQGVKQETVIKKMPILAQAAYERLKEEWLAASAINLMPECNGWGPAGVLEFAIGYVRARPENSWRLSTFLTLEDDELDEDDIDDVREFVDWVGLHVSDGWKPGEEYRGVLSALRKIAAKKAE